MGALGIFLTTWGLDELNGTERYTFGSYHLYEGLPLVPFLVGLFAMSEVLIGAERAAHKVRFDTESLTVKLPGLKTLGRQSGPFLLIPRPNGGQRPLRNTGQASPKALSRPRPQTTRLLAVRWCRH